MLPVLSGKVTRQTNYQRGESKTALSVIEYKSR